MNHIEVFLKEKSASFHQRQCVHQSCIKVRQGFGIWQKNMHKEYMCIIIIGRPGFLQKKSFDFELTKGEMILPNSNNILAT